MDSIHVYEYVCACVFAAGIMSAGGGFSMTDAWVQILTMLVVENVFSFDSPIEWYQSV